MCMCVGVKNHIVTCEKCMFWYKKEYEWILALGSPKKYYFHRTLLAMSGCPTREATKKIYTLQEPLVGGNRHDTGGTGSRMC